MVFFTIEQVRKIMDRKDNIRNMTVIAHVDHGKTTLTDSLVQMAGIIAAQKAGEQRFTDTRADEQERCITIKSTAVSMYYELDEDQIKDIHSRNLKVDGPGFLVNLIDSPGHVDFSSEVTAALRVTDGALVVVDAISGVCVQTQTVLRQAISERVKPVLFINKIDGTILTIDLSPEDLYQKLVKVVESVNVIIDLNSDKKSPMGDILVDPRNGSVGFGSGLQSWAFDIPTLARYYARVTSKPDATPEEIQSRANKLAQRMWGDHFYNPKTNKWLTTKEEGYSRGFNFFVLDPIRRIYDACVEKDNEKLKKMMVKLAPHAYLNDDTWALDVKQKFKTLMNKWSPSGKTLLYMIAVHLPSPVIAQKYRMELLYAGPPTDPAAIAIRDCDPKAPVMMYVSKMIPTGNKDGFFAFGRVFAGTIAGGQEIRILGPNFEYGKPGDVTKCNLQRACIMIGKNAENLPDIPCGNIAALVGVDKHLKKSGTVTTFDDCWNIRTMRFSVSPVVRVAVTPVNQQDLPKLITGLTRLSKSDPMVLCYAGATGEHIIAGAGELHLEICLKDLEEEHAGIKLKKSDPIVQYRETVSEKSSTICLAKSANKHNRLFATAEPLDEEVTKAIEENIIKPTDELRARARFMADNYQFNVDEGRKIWCFGPDGKGPNILIDSTKSVQFLNEIKDHVVGGFHQATIGGVLCEESMRGIRFDLHDVVLHADSIHRGAGQISPCARKVFLAAQRAADPKLVEPVYLVEIECDTAFSNNIYSVIFKKRGVIVEEEDKSSTIRIIKAYLPVNESFGFTAEIRSATKGHGFPQCIFDHWQIMNDDPYASDSKSNSVIVKIRERKGLPADLPSLNFYNETL